MRHAFKFCDKIDHHEINNRKRGKVKIWMEEKEQM